MKTISHALRIFALAACMLTLTSLADAQNNQSWVAIGGNDADPCTYILPCLTFQGAHNKTNPGGTVSAKVSGDYGLLNITKSITIDGAGVAAYIHATAGFNAINISAPNNSDVIILRNLILNGLGAGNRGISHFNTSLLIVDKVRIAGFSQGYFAQGTVAATPLRAEISYSNFDGNTTGVEIRGNTAIALSNCVITGTLNKGGTPFGVNIQPQAGTEASVKIEFCEISHCQSAIRATGTDLGNGTPKLWFRSNHLYRNTVAFNSTVGVELNTDSLNRMSHNDQNVPTNPGSTFSIPVF